MKTRRGVERNKLLATKRAFAKHGAARVAMMCGLQKDAPEWDLANTGEYMDGDTKRYHASCTVRVSFPGGGSVTEIGSADSGSGLFKNNPLTPYYFGGFKNNPSYAHVVFFYDTYPQ